MNWSIPCVIGNVPAYAALRWGARDALVFEGRRWTYSQLDAEVDQVAKALIAMGVRRGDHVGVWLVNCPEWVFLQFAIPRIGAVTVGLNTRYQVDDLAYAVDQSDCSVLVASNHPVTAGYHAILADVVSRLPSLKGLVMVGDETFEGATSWDELMARGADVSDDALRDRAETVNPSDPAVIIYTSGTTSRPKGAVHSHRWLQSTVERALLFGHTCTDVHLSYLPLFHVYGYSDVSAMSVLTGGKQVLLSSFDADTVLDLAEAEAGTVLHGFDIHWANLIAAQEERPRQLALRFGTLAAGMASSTAIARRAQEVLCPTVSGYGMSETWVFVAASHVSHTIEQRCEASGYPMPGIEIKAIDPESGRDQEVDMPGELLIRGYTVTSGYYRKPEETAETIDKDGWVHSGDLGRIRPDGHVVLMGRIKDMLKVGGENVSPAEIEAQLADLPGVKDVAVVGYPDARLGEVPVAYVVASDRALISENDIAQHLHGRIAKFKIPRHVQFVESFPMTPTGKVRKIDLRARALDDFSGRASSAQPVAAPPNESQLD